MPEVVCAVARRGVRLARRAVSACEAWGNVKTLVWGLGFGVWGLGFGVWGLGFGVWDFEIRASAVRNSGLAE